MALISWRMKDTRKQCLSLFPQRSVLKINSYLFFYFEQLLYSHLLVLGNPSGSVDTPKTPSTAVLKKLQVIKSNLHKWSTGRRHLIMTKYTTAKPVKIKDFISTYALWIYGLPHPCSDSPKQEPVTINTLQQNPQGTAGKEPGNSQSKRLCKRLHTLYELLEAAGR